MIAKKDTALGALQHGNKGKEQQCVRCKRIREVTVDHIIPKHLLEQLGLFDEVVNWPENYELMCLACNRFKGGQIDMANPKTVPLLKEVIKKIDVDNSQTVSK